MQRRRGLGALAADDVPMTAPAAPAGNVAALAAQVQQLQAQMRRMQEKDGMQRVPPGALVEYYGDLASGVLPPENMRIEELRFSVQIDPAGNITAQTDPIQVISRYNFAFRRIVGFALNPAFAGAGPGLVTFQVQEAGRNFPIFKTPINLQSVLSTNGAGNPAVWDGVYIAYPGTQMEVVWSVDTRWAALVGTTQEYGIQLIGDNVVCSPG